MHNKTIETTAIAPFPPCVAVRTVSYADEALKQAQIFYTTLPDAPRTVREAQDEFDCRTLATDTRLVGGTKQPTRDPYLETTLEAANYEISDLAVIDQRLDHVGRGMVLCHSADINPDNPDDANHRLLLFVWDEDASEHYMADVTKGVRVDNWHEYNEEVAARLEPNGDGTFSAPAGQVRYVALARNLNPGIRIVYQARARMVIDITDVEDTEIDLKHNGQVVIEFADGDTVSVPADLEITYVDNAG